MASFNLHLFPLLLFPALLFFFLFPVPRSFSTCLAFFFSRILCWCLSGTCLLTNDNLPLPSFFIRLTPFASYSPLLASSPFCLQTYIFPHLSIRRLRPHPFLLHLFISSHPSLARPSHFSVLTLRSPSIFLFSTFPFSRFPKLPLYHHSSTFFFHSPHACFFHCLSSVSTCLYISPFLITPFPPSNLACSCFQ